MDEYSVSKAYSVWYDKTNPSNFVKACKDSAKRIADAKWQKEQKEALKLVYLTTPVSKL